MKSVNKIFTLIIIFAIALSFSACSGANATKADNKQLPKSDYPPAPTALMDASLDKSDGSKMKLSDLKGKVILLNAWATWCGPCRQEIPELINLQKAYGEKGLAVIGLNVDEEEDFEIIGNYSKEMGVNYEMVKADRELFREFLKVSQRDAIPQSFLIDREGKLVGVFVGAGKSLNKLVEATKTLVNQ